LQGLAHRLQELGYRMTPQRMMVVAAIDKSDDHISVEEIYSQIRAVYPQVNISTVYRTLELLKSLGLVMETDLGEGRVRYHSADKGHHHHLVCKNCGVIIDLRESSIHPLSQALEHEYGFEADLRHLAIFGRCRECAKKRRAKDV
jgi:Fur family ferric uptake transcriptional regulator